MTRRRISRPSKRKQPPVEQESTFPAIKPATRAQNARLRAFIIALFVIAIALRVVNLTSQSLWADEGNSVRLTERSLSLVIDAARADVHPPGYYVLLWGWAKLFGQSEVAVRALSVVIGVLVVALVYLLARRLFGARAGWLAAFCAAVSPFQIVYSQEVRMYILVAFWGIAATYTLAGWFDAENQRQRVWWSVAYTLSIAMGLWTHYSFPIVIAAFNVAWLVWWIGNRGRPDWWRSAIWWLSMHTLAIVLYLPWLPIAWNKIFSYGAISASHSISFIVSQALKLLSVGETVPDDDLTKWLIVGMVGLFIFGAWGGLAPSTPSRSRKQSTIHTLTLILLTLAPIIMMVALTLTGRPAYRPKFFLVASPAFCILAGNGIAQLEQTSGQKQDLSHRMWLLLGLSLVAVGAARSLYNYYEDPAYARSDYRGIAELITRIGREGDAVLLNAPNQWEVFTYYYPPRPGRAPVYPLCRTRPPVEAEVVAELNEIASRHDRLFVLYWAAEQSDPERIVERWLETNSFKAMDEWYGDVRLVMYAVPQDLATVKMAYSLDGVHLGESIALRGYTLAPETIQRGDIVQITLFWEALDVPGGRYKTFLHLVDAGGQIVAQFDGEPGDGINMTTGWQPEQGVFPDRYGVLVPASTPPGTYQLLVGMYDISGEPRLPILQNDSPIGDALTLAKINIR
ncbi:MAG: glycosyltransferase family 39 protein [Anaerolineae bacterium]|nr:glycosyltransferase family 39 protein [Anaerolineae bacterium]